MNPIQPIVDLINILELEIGETMEFKFSDETVTIMRIPNSLETYKKLIEVIQSEEGRSAGEN